MFHSSRVHFVWVRLLSAICRLLIRSVGGPQTPDHYIERLKVASRLIKSSRISTDLECRENIHLFQPFSFFCFKRILRKSWRGVLFFFLKKRKMIFRRKWPGRCFLARWDSGSAADATTCNLQRRLPVSAVALGTDDAFTFSSAHLPVNYFQFFFRLSVCVPRRTSHLLISGAADMFFFSFSLRCHVKGKKKKICWRRTRRKQTFLVADKLTDMAAVRSRK